MEEKRPHETTGISIQQQGQSHERIVGGKGQPHTCWRGGAVTWEESGMEGTALWEVRLDIYLWTIDKIEIHIRGQGQTHTWEDCDGT